MKKLLTGILFIGILCLTTNITLACDCGCGKEEKVQVTNECVKKDCDCGCAEEQKAKIENKCVKKDCDCGCVKNKECNCPKEEIKKCKEKCFKKCYKSCLKNNCKRCHRPCSKKYNRPCNKPCYRPCDKKFSKPCSKSQEAKSVSDIIDETVTEGKDCKCKELNICSKTYNRCKWRKHKRIKNKRDFSKCKEQGCPIKNEAETSEE